MFSSVKFIKNLLKSKQVKNIDVNDDYFIITLKNDIVINIIIENNSGIYDNMTYSRLNCYIERLKNDEYIEDWEVFSEKESNEINSILFDYSINMQ